MKKILFIIIGVLVVAGGAVAGVFSWRYLRGAGPALLPPIGNIGQELQSTTTPLTPGSSNETNLPLTLSDSLKIRVLARDLPGARVLLWNPDLSALYVSRTSEGKVTELQLQDGKVNQQIDVYTGLRKPHGLALNPEEGDFYIATEDAIYSAAGYGAEKVKIVDLPLGGRHFTRSLVFGKDGRLYVSLGSSCDVCHEKEDKLATVQVLDPTKADNQLTLFAHGLRNAVFMALNPRSGEIWTTEMGRDFLGDDLPPDEINILHDGNNYGWPICYGQNIHDTVFDKNTYIRNPCMEPFETPSVIDLPAHSAPLGLAFVPETWPEPYRGDLLVAYHGSWNRTTPTGYKIVRFDLDQQGKVVSPEGHDFISGWLDEGRSLGRPVDLKFFDDKLYVSDDKAGLIYEVSLTD